MFAVKRFECPKCRSKSKALHCKIKANCSWYVCNCSLVNQGILIVFDEKGRYFYGKEN